VFGFPIAGIGLSDVLEYIRSAIASSEDQIRPRMIAYANAHTCNLCTENEDFRRSLLRADLIYVDGNGPRLAAWLQGDSLPARMTGADWLEDLCQLCERHRFRLYFLGAMPGVAKEAAKRLKAKFPGLPIVGVQDGYLPPEREELALEDIHKAQPDILVLGMGSPRQEIWMARRKDDLRVPVVWGAGGVFDYASGRIPRPPWWMRRLALEWLGRMLIEPRRLAGRYLVGIPVFIARSLRHGLRRRLHRLIP
jgi:N-acetylglucosaminyldiphosphoundecaprenol N-acetyl-beta-D-mannosaminyltransferase